MRPAIRGTCEVKEHEHAAEKLENRVSGCDCLDSSYRGIHGMKSERNQLRRGETIVKSSKLLLAALFFTGALRGAQVFGASMPSTTQTNSSGGVAVKATLLDAKTSDNLRFQIAFDTHSVNLDGYDLKAISFLRDDAGKTYLPTAVEDRGSGHHRQSTVIFGKIASGTKYVELVIKDVAGVKERKFRWELE